MGEKVLHLTLKKKWFDEILAGKKKWEYRELKPYWERRLFTESGEPRAFSHIRFRNGYQPTSRAMDVEFLGVYIIDGVIAIKLGRILNKYNM